jgi:hypothetical protein
VQVDVVKTRRRGEGTPRSEQCGPVLDRSPPFPLFLYSLQLLGRACEEARKALTPVPSGMPYAVPALNPVPLFHSRPSGPPSLLGSRWRCAEVSGE